LSGLVLIQHTAARWGWLAVFLYAVNALQEAPTLVVEDTVLLLAAPDQKHLAGVISLQLRSVVSSLMYDHPPTPRVSLVLSYFS